MGLNHVVRKKLSPVSSDKCNRDVYRMVAVPSRSNWTWRMNSVQKWHYCSPKSPEEDEQGSLLALNTIYDDAMNETGSKVRAKRIESQVTRRKDYSESDGTIHRTLQSLTSLVGLTTCTCYRYVHFTIELFVCTYGRRWFAVSDIWATWCASRWWCWRFHVIFTNSKRGPYSNEYHWKQTEQVNKSKKNLINLSQHDGDVLPSYEPRLA